MSAYSDLRNHLDQGKRIEDIPSIADLEKTIDYVSSKDDYSKEDDNFLGELHIESELRKREKLRLNDVPSLKDLYKVSRYADAQVLETRKKRLDQGASNEEIFRLPETVEEETAQLAKDELGYRKTNQMEELLNAERVFDEPRASGNNLRYEESGETVYLEVRTDELVKGVRYRNNSEVDAEKSFAIEEMAETIREIKSMINDEIDVDPPKFVNIPSSYRRFARGLERQEEIEEKIDRTYDQASGQPLPESLRTYLELGKEVKKELDELGAVHFTIEGFNTEEIASLVQRTRTRDRFEILDYETFEDTSMNEEEIHEFHKKWVLNRTAEDNALRIPYENEN